MATLTPQEEVQLEELFEMEGGHVLHFSHPSLRRFVIKVVNIDLDEPKYASGHSGSKANRVRALWDASPDRVVGQLIDALIDHRGHRPVESVLAVGDEESPDAQADLVECCRRIGRRLQSGATIEVLRSSALDPLSHEFIEEQVEKCDAKMTSGDSSGAITNARTMVEVVLLALEKKLYSDAEDHKGDIMKMYKRVAQKLNLAPGHDNLSTPLRQVLTGLASVVQGLAAVRSMAGDAHGRLHRTHPHHARVAVNAAKTFTVFMLDTFEYQQDGGS